MGRVIIGAGGFARDVFLHLRSSQAYHVKAFAVSTPITKDSVYGVPVIPFEKILPSDTLIMGIGDLHARQRLCENELKSYIFNSVVSEDCRVEGEDVILGEGTIICPYCCITSNIKIGKHVHVNLNSTIGHDCILGDYITIGPGVNISGNCKIGSRVQIGTNAAIREGTTICDDVIIGMGSVVLKDITESGVYVGNPVRKIK